MSPANPTKWAVSKKRNVVLSKAATFEEAETDRYRLMSNSLRQLDNEDDVVQEIDKLWREAQEKFLAIGRYLVKAREQFRGTFEAMILPQLPFGKGVAYQLRAVAIAVDEGRLLEEEMPRSYATAYQLVSLSPGHMELARQKNLVRPDVLRREIEAFRAALKDGATRDREAELRVEWQRLRHEAARIATRMAEIEQELGPALRRSGAAP